MTDDISSYIGKRGYTIYKEALSVRDQRFIREELTVAPFIPKCPIKPESFSIFQESQNKFYLPKYFGIENFGQADKFTLSDGEPINLNFNGNLFPNQIEIVDAYFKSIDKTLGGGGLLDVPCGFGKTAMALYIISKLSVKTIVIVHKGFLVNQWIERANEFLPEAKIGRIQGQIIDIENKDIVIGMLQSLSTKSYPHEMISKFGLTVVDECHHISSQVFSRSLLHFVTKYTLGLSATMERKDGLTHVFKLFLGDIVYSVKREKEDNVLVKAIEYNSNDKEFEEVKYDYKGNPQYSSMITKICSYNDRTEFILKVIKKELIDYPNQQIMILAQNKNILVYLFNAINHRNIASVGYYIGGMKEEQLKESENKKIIVATYAMAAEGLDIKTLSTLVLATPRTDITQAVGRILRVKRERPLVIDIVDDHTIFKNQYKKRKSFYKKNNYQILETNNKKYFNNDYTLINKKNTKSNSKPVVKSKCLLSI